MEISVMDRHNTHKINRSKAHNGNSDATSVSILTANAFRLMGKLRMLPCGAT